MATNRYNKKYTEREKHVTVRKQQVYWRAFLSQVDSNIQLWHEPTSVFSHQKQVVTNIATEYLFLKTSYAYLLRVRSIQRLKFENIHIQVHFGYLVCMKRWPIILLRMKFSIDPIVTLILCYFLCVILLKIKVYLHEINIFVIVH